MSKVGSGVTQPFGPSPPSHAAMPPEQSQKPTSQPLKLTQSDGERVPSW